MEDLEVVKAHVSTTWLPWVLWILMAWWAASWIAVPCFAGMVSELDGDMLFDDGKRTMKLCATG